MEAPEVPTEHLHEQIHESVHESEHGHGEGPKWIMGVALSSAIIAAFAAVASLLAGANVNLAMINQMKASDQWNYYQAKGVKMNVLKSKIEMLSALGKTPEAKDKKKVEQYENDQKSIKEEADTLEEQSQERLEIHETMAKSVTFFQVAIAIAAISALTKRRAYWFVGLVSSVVGLYLFSVALSSHLKAEKAEAEEAAEEQKAEQAEAAKGEGGKPEKQEKKEGKGEKPAPEKEHSKETKAEAGEGSAKPEAPKANGEESATPKPEGAEK